MGTHWKSTTKIWYFFPFSLTFSDSNLPKKIIFKFLISLFGEILPVQKTTGSYRADYKQDLKKTLPNELCRPNDRIFPFHHLALLRLQFTSCANFEWKKTQSYKRNQFCWITTSKDGTCKIQWRRELLYIKLVDCSRGKVAHISMPASQTLGILSFKIYTTNRLNWWHVALVAWTGSHVYRNALSGEHSLIWNTNTVDISQMPRASTVSEL